MNIKGYLDTIRVFIIVVLIALAWAASDGLSAQTPTTPGKPAISSITAGDRLLAVDWDAPADNGGAAIVDYEVQYRSGASGEWSNTATYSISTDSNTPSTDQWPGYDLGA